MTLAYATNRLLRRFGYQLVRNGTLTRLLAPPPTAGRTLTHADGRVWNLGDHRGIVRATNGNYICIDTRDASVGHPIRDSGCWEPHVETICRRLVNPGSVAIDVGANIGYHTAVLARVAQFVLAVEANPVTTNLLRVTIALNGFRNVRIVEHAVMDRPQAIELFAPDEHLGAGAVGRPEWYENASLSHWRRHPVDALTLDSVTEDVRTVDLIRMDIEGCELPALRGAHALLSRSPHVRIVLEWGAYNAPLYGDIAEGLEYLGDLGFAHFAKIEADGSLTPKSKDEMLNRLGMHSHDVCDVAVARSPSFGL